MKEFKSSQSWHGSRSALMALLAATIIWGAGVHLVFKQPLASFHSSSDVPPKARELAARHLPLWTDPVLQQSC